MTITVSGEEYGYVIMELLVVQFPLLSCYLFSLGSKIFFSRL
jgi:hypothetical protein